MKDFDYYFTKLLKHFKCEEDREYARLHILPLCKLFLDIPEEEAIKRIKETK